MKSLSKNIIASVITRIIALISGLIVQQRILLVYGSDLNGLTSSITQIMSYLVIFEAGLGAASIQALYKPLSENNWKDTSGILVATGKAYRKIATIFFIVLSIVSMIYPILVANEIKYSIAAALTFITGGSYIVAYIFGAKYKVLLDANRKIYVVQTMEGASVLLSCILRVIAMNNGAGIVLVQMVHLCCVALKNGGFILYVKKNYSVDYSVKPIMNAINKRWNVLVHNLSGLVVNHTDILILTIFSSLKYVSIYSVYNMIYGQISNMIQTVFIQAPQASFGKLFFENKNRFILAYKVYEICYTGLLFLLTSVAIIMTTSFISLYTRSVIDVTYSDKYLPLLFGIILLMNALRVPAIMVINISGSFKETQRGAIFEAIINIAVSLTLFFATPLKLYGLLIGTFCSYLYRTFDVIWFVYRKVLKISIVSYIKNFIVNILITVLFILMLYFLYPLSAKSYFTWALTALAICIVLGIAYLGINFLINFKYMKQARILLMNIIMNVRLKKS